MSGDPTRTTTRTTRRPEPPHRHRRTAALALGGALLLGACADPRDETPGEPGFEQPNTMPPDVTQAPRTGERGGPTGDIGVPDTNPSSETTFPGATPGLDIEDLDPPGGNTTTTNNLGLDGVPPG